MVSEGCGLDRTLLVSRLETEDIAISRALWGFDSLPWITSIVTRRRLMRSRPVASY